MQDQPRSICGLGRGCPPPISLADEARQRPARPRPLKCRKRLFAYRTK